MEYEYIPINYSNWLVIAIPMALYIVAVGILVLMMIHWKGTDETNA